MMNLLQALYKIRDTVLPPHCVGCGTQGDELCKPCKKNLAVHHPMCRSCHRPNRDSETCVQCFYNNPLTGVLIAFRYTGPLKRLILGLKFQHQYTISTFLAQKLSLLIQTHDLLQKALTTKTLIITHVPSHRRRKRMVKGYNQSELLAKAIAHELKVPYIPLTTKTKRTRSQVRLKRSARLRNLHGVFAVEQKERLDEKVILVVDDIITTGSTLKEVAHTIKKAYPSTTIRGCVVARHGK